MELALVLLSALGCAGTTGDTASDTAPAKHWDPYVRLDGVVVSTFHDALRGAVDGSVIEFCGRQPGPFSRSDLPALPSLTIEGCDRDAAIIDGGEPAVAGVGLAALEGDFDAVTLRDLTIRGGTSGEEVFPSSCGDCNNYHLTHAAAVDRVRESLVLERVALTGANAGNAYGGDFDVLSVSDGDPPDDRGGDISGTDVIAQRNDQDRDEPCLGDVTVFRLRPGGSLTLEHADFGIGDDENGSCDIAVYWRSDSFDLHGIVDARCSENGCEITQVE